MLCVCVYNTIYIQYIYIYIYIYIYYIKYTMIMSYIKGANRLIFTHTHPCAGWCVSYTPRIYYTHLGNVSFQLITGPLVEIVIE